LQGKVLSEMGRTCSQGVGLIEGKKDKFLNGTRIENNETESQEKPGDLSEYYFDRYYAFHLMAKLHQNDPCVL
jgi:hypothetical protein